MERNVQAQRSTSTAFNRYPQIFRSLQTAIAKSRPNSGLGRGLRVLSFGCSTAAEMLTARAYFPDADILGCDINPDVLDEASRALECDLGKVFLSSERAIAALGPYDVVLANSVMCSYPASTKLSSLSGEFSFSQFEYLVEMLSKSINPGGFLSLVNSNYFFRDLPCAAEYSAVSTPFIESAGFVEKFDSSGQKVSQVPEFKSQRHHAHSIIEGATRYSDDDFRACLFSKKCVTQNEVVPTTITEDAPGELVLGGNPFEYANKNWLGAGLYVRWVDCEPHKHQAIYDWRRSTEAGRVVSLGTWTQLTTATSEYWGRVESLRWQERPKKKTRRSLKNIARSLFRR